MLNLFIFYKVSYRSYYYTTGKLIRTDKPIRELKKILSEMEYDGSYDSFYPPTITILSISELSDKAYKILKDE